MRKELIVVGGPNGAGKTTFANEFVARHRYTYLGADLIAYELAPHDVDSVQVEAAREFIRRFEDYVARGESFVVESTLSGKSLAQRMKKAKAAGYDISVVFIFIDSAETSLHRVRARVFKGGHDVPEVDIRRRFLRTAQNFWHLYREIADQWSIRYNGVDGRVDVADGGEDSWVVHDDRLFDRFTELLGE